MSVVDIIQEQDEMMAHEHHFILWPRQWKTYVDTHNWKSFRLDKTEKNHIPKRAGVYSLLVQPGIANHPACSYLMYIGKTTSLYRRFMDYLNERNRDTGRPKILRVLNKYKDYVCFCYTTVHCSAPLSFNGIGKRGFASVGLMSAPYAGDRRPRGHPTRSPPPPSRSDARSPAA